MAPNILKDNESSYRLIRRLVTEYGTKHWKSYATAFVLMAISALGKTRGVCWAIEACS